MMHAHCCLQILLGILDDAFLNTTTPLDVGMVQTPHLRQKQSPITLKDASQQGCGTMWFKTWENE
jgi:hypothetical protein